MRAELCHRQLALSDLWSVTYKANRSVHRKFGKQIQRRQLDLPEYAASFVNYKALKKVGTQRGIAVLRFLWLRFR